MLRSLCLLNLCDLQLSCNFTPRRVGSRLCYPVTSLAPMNYIFVTLAQPRLEDELCKSRFGFRLKTVEHLERSKSAKWFTDAFVWKNKSLGSVAMKGACGNDVGFIVVWHKLRIPHSNGLLIVLGLVDVKISCTRGYNVLALLGRKMWWFGRNTTLQPKLQQNCVNIVSLPAVMWLSDNFCTISTICIGSDTSQQSTGGCYHVIQFLRPSATVSPNRPYGVTSAPSLSWRTTPMPGMRT